MSGDIADEITMIEVMTLRIKAMRQAANAEAAATLKTGARQPGFAGGQKLGYLTIPESKPHAEVTGPAALTEWAAEHYPDSVTVTIKPSWLTDPYLIDLVKEHFPAAVEQSVRPSFLGDLREAVASYGGWPDKQTGEILPVPGMLKVAGGEPLPPRVTLDKYIKEVAATPRAPLPAGIAAEAGRAVFGIAPEEASALAVTTDG